MPEVSSILLTILYTLKSLVIYSLITSVVLTIVYYPGLFLFNLFSKKMNWNLATFFSAYILVLVFVVLIYFCPLWFFGLPLKGYEIATDKLVFVLKLIGLFLMYSLAITFIVQIFVFFGAYLLKKLKFKSSLFNTYITMLIIGLILSIILMIFPWIPGGLLAMIIF